MNNGSPLGGGGGSGASFDPASPGPIGGTTPAAGTFTQVTVNPGTVTTAGFSAISLAQTNNNALVDTGVKWTFTDTSSAAGFLPFQILGGAAGTTNLLSVSKAGLLTVPTISFITVGTKDLPTVVSSASAAAIYFGSGNLFGVSFSTFDTLRISNLTFKARSDLTIGWVPTNTDVSVANDTAISRISANLIGVGNGTAADFSGSLKLASLLAATGTITVSTPAIDVTQTWNAGGTTFTGLRLNVTNPASAAASMLMDLQISTVSMLNFTPINGRLTFSSTAFAGFGQIAAINRIDAVINAISQASFNTTGMRLQPSGQYGFSSATDSTNATDTALNRQAAGIVGIDSTAGGTGFAGSLKLTKLYQDYTITAAAATGPKTINKGAGTIRIAAAGTSVTLTDSLITANTMVIPHLRTVDTTAKSVVSVPAAGSCVFTLNAASTAEIEIGFTIINTD